jgi:hypothetical protein
VARDPQRAFHPTMYTTICLRVRTALDRNAIRFMIARGKRLIVRTVAFQQVMAVTFFSVNLMQASSLNKDGSPIATTKEAEGKSQ